MSKFAVTREVLDTGTGTQAFDITGFGTPTAAIIMCTYGVTDDTVTADNQISFGVVDGTNQWCMVSSDEDGQSTTDSVTQRITDGCLIVETPGVATPLINCAFSSFNTDNVTLNITVNDDSQPLVTVILISGTSNVTASSFNNDTTNPVDVELGYEPDLVFTNFMSTSSASNVDLIHCLGIAHNDTSTVQKNINLFSDNGLTTTLTNSYVSTNRFWLKQDNSGTSDYSGAITFSGATPNGFTSTPTGNPGASTVYYLALKFTDATNIKLVEYDTPTVSGSASMTGAGFTPDFGMIWMSAATVRDSTRSTDEDGWGVAAVSGSTVYSNSASSDDGVVLGTTVCKSISSDQLTLLHDGDTVLQQASFTAFNSDGAEFNYSTPTSGGTARMWFALFTAEPAAGGGVLGGIAGPGGVAGEGGIAGKHGGIAG